MLRRVLTIPAGSTWEYENADNGDIHVYASDSVESKVAKQDPYYGWVIIYLDSFFEEPYYPETLLGGYYMKNIGNYREFKKVRGEDDTFAILDDDIASGRKGPEYAKVIVEKINYGQVGSYRIHASTPERR